VPVITRQPFGSVIRTSITFSLACARLRNAKPRVMAWPTVYVFFAVHPETVTLIAGRGLGLAVPAAEAPATVETARAHAVTTRTTVFISPPPL
jgi:hypothetical protein